MKYNVVPFGSLLAESTRNGLTKPKSVRGSGIKMISMGEIFANGHIGNIDMDLVPVTDKEYKNYGVQSGDLLFARQSLVLEGAGKCSIVDTASQPTVFESHLIRARTDPKKANPYFLYYYFNSYYGKENIKTIVEQVAAAGIRGSDLVRLSVPNPPIDFQNKIAAVLKKIDDKISLNQKIDDNLEQQAQALFLSWKAENLGNYETSPLSEVAAINADTYSPKSAWDYVNYLDTSSITNGIISEVQHINPSTDKLPSRARRIIRPNDIVFSTVRPNQNHFGIIKEPLDNMLASTGFAVIRSKIPSVSNELLYLCLTENSFIEKMQQLAEQSTSTFPSIKPSDLDNCKIPHPITAELKELLSAIFSEMALRQNENRRLADIRDTLLPKLMSGEIDVSEIQI